jgi:CRISPR system Cascade subunit CasA
MKKPMPDKPPDREKTPPVTFDLRDERWIPVVREDGSPDELSLRTVLRDAPHLRDIRDPLPTVEFGLYRLLVALVLDIFALKSADDLEDLLKAGDFDTARVDAYFEKWHDRFNLFDPAHPFLQTVGMVNEKPKPLAGLMNSIPSGTGANHFHHADESVFCVCPAVAARLLTTIAPFMTAGGAGLSPSINGAPPWYVLVRGRSLFETVCLNCPVMRDLLPLAQGDEPPAWRGNTPVTAQRRTSASLLEALTWQPRRIQLVPDGPGCCALTGRETPVLVREMKFSAGFGAGFEWTDPNVPYRIGKDERKVLRPREGKAVWRDIGPIALLRERDYQSANGKVRFDRPTIVNQFAKLLERRTVDKSLALDLVVYGMRTDLKMKVFEWRRENLSVPTPLLWGTRFQLMAQQEMERADSVEYALGKAIKRVYPREGAGNKKAYDALIARTQSGFWTALRPSYEVFLQALALLSTDDTDRVTKVTKILAEAIRRVAEEALNAAIEDLDTDADALERQTAARRSFANALFVLLDPAAAAKVREKKKKKIKKEDKQ